MALKIAMVCADLSVECHSRRPTAIIRSFYPAFSIPGLARQTDLGSMTRKSLSKSAATANVHSERDVTASLKCQVGGEHDTQKPEPAYRPGHHDQSADE